MYNHLKSVSGGLSQMNTSRACDQPLIDQDEMELLRSELLEAYTTPRETMKTRDEDTEMKKTEFLMREAVRAEARRRHADLVEEELKEKKQRLTIFFENVLADQDRERKRYRKTKGNPLRHTSLLDDDDDDDVDDGDNVQNFERINPEAGKIEINKLIEVDRDSMNEVEYLRTRQKTFTEIPKRHTYYKSLKLTPLKSAEEKVPIRRSKFALKTLAGARPPSPPRPSSPPRTPAPPRPSLGRKDARFSKDHNRFSFQVDVEGPFRKIVDPDEPPPDMRDVATQTMLSDNEEVMDDWDNEYARYSNAARGKAYYARYSDASGDDFSSNLSADFWNGLKKLERKESKRREAEVMVRPRGYKDLDLKDAMPFITFEAETQVASYDLDKEKAARMGITVARDNILWPTCKEFDADKIARNIEDYINRCWTIDSKWLFTVQRLQLYHDNYRKRYVYEVKFSVPSPTTPVPPATASVFFTFEIPIYSKRTDQVQVTYVLEGNRFAHKPGKIPFQDMWLWQIISDKMKIQKAVNF